MFNTIVYTYIYIYTYITLFFGLRRTDASQQRPSEWILSWNSDLSSRKFKSYELALNIFVHGRTSPQKTGFNLYILSTLMRNRSGCGLCQRSAKGRWIFLQLGCAIVTWGVTTGLCLHFRGTLGVSLHFITAAGKLGMLRARISVGFGAISP